MYSSTEIPPSRSLASLASALAFSISALRMAAWKRSKGRKVERSKGRKVERSKGRKVERSKIWKIENGKDLKVVSRKAQTLTFVMKRPFQNHRKLTEYSKILFYFSIETIVFDINILKDSPLSSFELCLLPTECSYFLRIPHTNYWICKRLYVNT